MKEKWIPKTAIKVRSRTRRGMFRYWDFKLTGAPPCKHRLAVDVGETTK